MKSHNFFSFLGGLTVGAIAALLMAPDTGKNTRHKIGDKIKQGECKIKGVASLMEQKIQQASQKAKLAAADIADDMHA